MSALLPLGASGVASELAHKALWPVNVWDFFVFCFAAVVLFVASAGGIGGGGVLVPLYNLAARFSTTQAVALSNITILGGALSNLCFNICRRHPFASRPLIDWDLILVMEPPTILGAVLGGYLNMLFPDVVTNLLLALLLSYMTYKLTQKARRMLIAESRLDDSVAIALDHVEVYETALEAAGYRSLPASQSANAEEPFCPHQSDEHFADADLQHQVQRMLHYESRQVPWQKVVVLLFLSGWVITSEMLKHSVKHGSLSYWIVAASPMPCVVLITLEARRHLLSKERLKQAAKIERLPGDVVWDSRRSLQFPALCTFAGLAAGLAGVGGGILKAPLMLQLGVLPEVVAATTATMILFTAGAAGIVYLSFGVLLPDYALALFALGVVVTFGGQLLVYYVVKLLGRRSIIVVMMALLMAAAMCITYMEVVMEFTVGAHVA